MEDFIVTFYMQILFRLSHCVVHRATNISFETDESHLTLLKPISCFEIILLVF